MSPTVEHIAQVAHEANRAYCRTIGDFSQPSWDNAPEWQRESAIAGVVFLQDNPDATPADSHASWLTLKEAEGWQYGLVKDPEQKLHPCMLPYNELPPEQQTKDALYNSVVRTLLSIN